MTAMTVQELLGLEISGEGKQVEMNLEVPPWNIEEPEMPQVDMTPPEMPEPIGFTSKPRDLSVVPLKEWTHEERLRVLPYAVRAAAAMRKSWGEPMDAGLYAIVFIAVTSHGV